MAVALDSDAIVGFLDTDDALYEVAGTTIENLLGKELLIASVVSYAEVMTGAKLGHHAEKDVRGFFSEVISEIVPVDREIGDRAAEIRAQRKALQLPDALILATADLDPGVERIVCGDQGFAKLKDLRCKVELLRPST